MALRIASAAIVLPLLIVIVWVGSPWFSVVVGVVAALGALELSGMARRWRDRPVTVVAVAWAVTLIVVGHSLADDPPAGERALPIVGIAAGVSLLWLLWHSRRGLGSSAWGVTAAIVLYTGGLLFHAPLLRGLDQGWEWMTLLLVSTFAADTSAFFVGKAIGRRPLAPSISPSKTWEGAGGAVVGALAASVASVYALALDASVWEALALGALIGTVGQLGDLVESQLKRNAGVKDSGRLMPGHGGVLDRLDSIVFNLVVVYYFVS